MENETDSPPAGEVIERETASEVERTLPELIAEVSVAEALPYYEPEPHWQEERRTCFLMYRGQVTAGLRSADGRRNAVRNMRTLADDTGRSESTIRGWAQEDDWTGRVREWDRMVEEEAQAAFLDETREASRRLARDAEMLQRGLLSPAKELVEQLDKAMRTGIDPWTNERVTLRDLFEMTAKASRAFPGLAQVERLARGLSTSNVEAHVEGAEAAEARRKVGEWSAGQARDYLLDSGFDDGSTIEGAVTGQLPAGNPDPSD